jgi:hypothetical protein
MKKNPGRQAVILKTKIMEKYGVSVNIRTSTREVTITKGVQGLARIGYSDENHLVNILNDIYEKESYLKGGQV